MQSFMVFPCMGFLVEAQPTRKFAPFPAINPKAMSRQSGPPIVTQHRLVLANPVQAPDPSEACSMPIAG